MTIRDDPRNLRIVETVYRLEILDMFHMWLSLFTGTAIVREK